VYSCGGPERPYNQSDIVDKFEEFAEPVLGKVRASKLRDAVLSLTDRDAMFSVVAECLYDPV